MERCGLTRCRPATRWFGPPDDSTSSAECDMTRRIRSEGTIPPRGLPTEDAAGYVGCQTIEQFEREVAAGIWPQPFSKNTRPKRWDIDALDAAMDRMSGIFRQKAGRRSSLLNDDATGLRIESDTFEERARNYSDGDAGD